MVTAALDSRSRHRILLRALWGLCLAASLLAAQSSPETAEELFKQGNEFSRHEKWKEAIETYRKAVALKPQYVEARYNLANALLAEQRLDDAQREYGEILRLRPDFPGVHRNLAGLYESQG